MVASWSVVYHSIHHVVIWLSLKVDHSLMREIRMVWVKTREEGGRDSYIGFERFVTDSARKRSFSIVNLEMFAHMSYSFEQFATLPALEVALIGVNDEVLVKGVLGDKGFVAHWALVRPVT